MAVEVRARSGWSGHSDLVVRLKVERIPNGQKGQRRGTEKEGRYVPVHGPGTALAGRDAGGLSCG